MCTPGCRAATLGWVHGAGGCLPPSRMAPSPLCTCCRGWKRAKSGATLCASPRRLGGPRVLVRADGGVEAGSTLGSCSGGSGFLAPGREREVLGALKGMQGAGGAAAPQHVLSLRASVASSRQSAGKGACRPSLSSWAPQGHPDLAQGLFPSPGPQRDGCSTLLPGRDAGMLHGSAQGSCFSSPPGLGPVGPQGGQKQHPHRSPPR